MVTDTELTDLKPLLFTFKLESQMVQNSRNKINLTSKKFSFYQGQERFQSVSTKSIHIQPIFSQGQDI